MRLTRRKIQPKPTTLEWARRARISRNPIIKSRALKVHKRQVAKANQVAIEMGCGAPFQDDGTFVDTRSNTKRYVEEINRRRGEGESRLVNFDGGYGDPI